MRRHFLYPNRYIISHKYFYKNLVCAFNYYDLVLEGLVSINNVLYLGSIIGDPFECLERPLCYSIEKIQVNDEIVEYINDYKKAYPQWFYKNGQRIGKYDPSIPIKWFSDKWNKRNPVRESIKC